MADAGFVPGKFVHGEDYLGPGVRNGAQGPEFAFTRFGACQQQGDLDIETLFMFFGNEVDFIPVEEPCGDGIATPFEFQKHEVFKDLGDIAFALSQNGVAKPQVAQIMFFIDFQMTFAFDIVASCTVKRVTGFEVSDIRQDGLCRHLRVSSSGRYCMPGKPPCLMYERKSAELLMHPGKVILSNEHWGVAPFVGYSGHNKHYYCICPVYLTIRAKGTASKGLAGKLRKN